jgi:hypothetical protein
MVVVAPIRTITITISRIGLSSVAIRRATAVAGVMLKARQLTIRSLMARPLRGRRRERLTPLA